MKGETNLSARRAYFLAVALAAIMAEGALLDFAFAERSEPRLLLSLHFTLCAGLAALAAAHRRQLDIASAFQMLTVWTFFAGPLGGLIASASAFANGAKQIVEFGEWFERQASGGADRVRALRSALLCQRLRIDGASAALPLRDVIADGSLKQKYDALNIIQRRFDPSFVAALQLAGVDSDQSVRVLAATVAIKLQTRFSSEIEALEAAADRAQTVEAWLALAEAHGRFAGSGLLSPAEAQEQIDMAAARHLDALECARAMNPARLQLIQQLVHAIEEKWPVDVSAERRKVIEQYQAEDKGSPPEKPLATGAPGELAWEGHGLRSPEEAPPKRKSQ